MLAMNYILNGFCHEKEWKGNIDIANGRGANAENVCSENNGNKREVGYCSYSAKAINQHSKKHSVPGIKKNSKHI